MSEYAIETRRLTKKFGGRVAVDDLNMQIRAGSVLGFLGVNGAGKTTTIRMLMGHLHPTAGDMLTLGRDPRNHDESTRQRVAYVSENMNLPGWMTPRNAVKFNASLYPKWDHRLAEVLLDEFELRGSGGYRHLSKGQKRKVCILIALCQNADLLIMDEPAAGLDVMARRGFLERVLDIACQEQKTVFISSHLLTDLERVADTIALIHDGRLMRQGNLEELKAGARKLHFSVAIARDELAQYFKVIAYEAGMRETMFTVMDFDEGRLRSFCEQKDCAEHVAVHGMNLEDIFVEMVKSNGGGNNIERTAQ